MSKLGRFVRLDGADQRLLLRAACWLAVARLLIASVPFRRLSAWLATESAPDCIEPEPELGPEPEQELLRRIGRAVATAARHVPWRADCFPQAIAARMLLRRHGLPSTIHIGVTRDEGKGLSGHAWLTCGKTVVTGEMDLDRYAVLHRLPDREPPAADSRT